MTVLGPIMFLLYINDTNVGISSSLRLFVNDCVLYRIIESDHDYNYVQSDNDQNFPCTGIQHVLMGPEGD